MEQRETKTGRIIINFKVTDYTSSFAMQRWVKDSEELVKFGMIKKGNWVRVRGRIENNPFTHSLTMNVQDIKEISHTPRKDLMPEGQKRVEFHAHTNMSTMDAIPTVEELIDTAAFWGHPAVAITDHANVQSFPHGYHKAKKAGIKAIFGLEANLVEDKVPIVYNSENLELKEATYVVFDVETTGLNPKEERIIELGAVLFENGQAVQKFNTLVNAEVEVSEFISNLTHITNEMLENQPREEKAYEMFQEFMKVALEGKVIVCAHNAKFDMSFLKETFNRLKLDGKICYVDTLSIIKKVYPWTFIIINKERLLIIYISKMKMHIVLMMMLMFVDKF